MTRFVQLHFLTIYPPSNPNRDGMGRPKTAIYGGVPRLRLSSQSLKRAARLSDAMRKGLEGHMGKRTRRIGEKVREHLLKQDTDKARADGIAKLIVAIFGEVDETAIKDDPSHVRSRQLVFVSPEEGEAACKWADEMNAKGETIPDLPKAEKERKRFIKPYRDQVLRTVDHAVDIAMFGRMLADSPEYNREAAVQLSHAITTHQAMVEDDYYTAVDDLKRPAEDMGAGFVGEAGFGSGVYYLYACIDTGLLLKNLDGDCGLARRAMEAVAEAFATATPSGKRNSYGHHARASYIRAESGETQPRSLAAAFLRPVEGVDLMRASIDALEAMATKFDCAYGPQADTNETMDVDKGVGSLGAIKSFISKQIRDA